MSDTPVSMTTLTWAVRVLILHATAVAILGVWTTWVAITSDSVSVTSAVATPLIIFFFAAVFGGLAYALHRLRSWARGPAIVMELLLIPIGLGAIGGVPEVGIAVALTGLAGAVLLLAPSTRGALGLDR